MSKLHRCPYFFTPFPARPDLPLFVFLPGMDETGRDLMTLQMAGLEAAFDVRCFVIPADSLDTWDALSNQLIALIKTELQQAPRQIYLCGESFGTCVGLTAIAQAPKLCDRMILINSASSFHRVPWLIFGSYLLPWTPHFIYDLSSIVALPFLAQVTRLSPAALKALMKATQAAPQSTAEQRLALLRKFRIAPSPLQAVTQPVLLIGSRHDRLLPSIAEAHHLAQVFPHAQIVTLPESGHACLIESDVDLLTILQSSHFLPN